MKHSRLPLLLGIVVGLCPAYAAWAQGGREPRGPHREVRGLDFRKDGVWRKQARAVRATRAGLLARRAFSALNAPLAAGRMASGAPLASGVAVAGTVRVPAVLFTYPDAVPPAFTSADYDAILFGGTPPAGRPYTLTSFYDEMSRGMLSIQGETFGWFMLPLSEAEYNGGTSTACQRYNPFGTANCNGVWSDSAFTAMQGALRAALAFADAQIDFSTFSYDIATGIVSLVLFAHSTIGGECGPGSTNDHLWAHRSFLWPAYQTNDPWPGHPGEFLKVQDYILESGLGGATSCSPTDIMPIGTVAHEMGHGFGLPDLYDTEGRTEGVGDWGLMGTGNYSSPFSPARMEAWSLNELGWVTLVPADTTGRYGLGAAPVSDTAFLVRPRGANTRGEYFLLENRQAVQADSALLRSACETWREQANRTDCPGGLLVWHLDSLQVVNGELTNTVNSGPIHGVELVQADGNGNLDADPSVFCCLPVPGSSDRGDAGDPYPGMTGNPRFSFKTNPAAVKNADSSFAGFAIDSLKQVVPNGTFQFRLNVGGLTVVRAVDSVDVKVKVDSVPIHVYRDLLDSGSVHLLDVPDPPDAPDGRTRYRFASWSDGGARAHTITAASRDTALIATMERDRLLWVTRGPHGTVTINPAQDTSGSFLPEGTAVTLTATADSGYVGGWIGDTTFSGATVTLHMARPYSVGAEFDPPLALTSPAARLSGVMGAYYTDTLRASGGNGMYVWSVAPGSTLPFHLSLDGKTGILWGVPTKVGNYSFQVSVISGAQTKTHTYTFLVTAPRLATADVVTQVLGLGRPLNADQVRYLDLLGNSNGVLDVGDFLAWVKLTGAPVATLRAGRATTTSRATSARWPAYGEHP